MSDKAHGERKWDILPTPHMILKTLKFLTWDVGKELYVGYRTRAIPTYLCLGIGIVISLAITFYVDAWIFSHFHKDWLLVPRGRFRSWVGIFSVVAGFFVWAVIRRILWLRTQVRLKRACTNAKLVTKLKEMPEFVSDFPIDEFARKLTVRGRGLTLSNFLNAKESLEYNLGINISKIESPGDNKEYFDIVYTTLALPELWVLDNLTKYKNFSFPIGMCARGEITANLKDIPHFLIAGESGGGKSTFIRMMLTVLLSNNQDLEIYFLDFKSGMENRMFTGFSEMHCLDSVSGAAGEMAKLKIEIDSRMKAFQLANARTIEMYNKSSERKGKTAKRILVVVDEVSELMPSMRGKLNSELLEINQVLSKISRMGRAIGISLVIGVQKPDTKNLDPTIKANLSGVLCFPVSHFSQSTIILGNDRACDLNKVHKGRAIWKHGIDMLEVQTPLVTEEEVINAKQESAKYWRPEPESALPAPPEFNEKVEVDPNGPGVEPS